MPQINTYRRKLLNAILFFCKNTDKNKCTKTKIFKLLFFFDFQHFKETGRSVTWLDYSAFDYGPVPKEFHEEIKDNIVPDDFKKDLAILPFRSEFKEKKGGIFKAKTIPNLSVFSPRQITLLNNFAEIYKEANANEISEISHLPKQPWSITKDKNGLYEKIDYLYAIDDKAHVSMNTAKMMIQEYKEIFEMFPLNPKI